MKAINMKSNFWFPFYTADFLAKTYHLNQARKGSYLNLILWYYENEKPIPVGFEYDAADARTDSDKDNTDVVLKLYFERDGDVWRNRRCDEVLVEIAQVRETKKKNGKLGGRPKKTDSKPAGFEKETDRLAKRNLNETQSQSQSQSNNTLSREEARRYGLKYVDTNALKVDREAMGRELAKAKTPEEAVKALMGGKL